MYNPWVTYRIQFNKDFDLIAFEKITGYLKKLGIKTIYASPVFGTVPGSMHGYDITDPHQLNKEIGILEQFETIVRNLQKQDIGWLQDIVPNHMAYHQKNKWLMDVLKYGKDSDYAEYFDIDWDNPLCKGQVLLPVLDKPLKQVVADGDLKIEFGAEARLDLKGTKFPLKEDFVIEEGINNDKAKLKKLIEQQHYKICEWQETSKHINYRRFFTINGMICVNVQHRKVFDDTHKLIKWMVEKKLLQGLRVDHIDGLYNPTEYLQWLRTMAGEDCYISVEKILEAKESLPCYWPVQGTTGYDFIALMDGLFTLPKNQKSLSKFYDEITRNKQKLEPELHEKKTMILKQYMRGELENLCRIFKEINAETAKVNDCNLSDAVAAFLVYCPMYRYYSNTLPLDVFEKEEIVKVFTQIKKERKELATEINLLDKVLTSHYDAQEEKERAVHFFMRCMQFTGPLMAKGVEDTLLYTYNRDIAHNEVGDSPEEKPTTVDDFHTAVLKRMRDWPLTMNATATHDTKRGEDARARLYVLPDVADEWIARVRKWRAMNAGYKTYDAPDNNDEYFIYQSLVASYPMPGMDMDNFEERFLAYIQKALREAKVHTDWARPDMSYEEATMNFVKNIMNDNPAFVQDFLEFHKQIADAGIINSLSQLILKCTCPGEPDVYQGCELWDLSMVDPDNRRPVDYALREQWLEEVCGRKDTDFIKNLWQEKYTGKIKLWLLQHLLDLRSNNKEVFASGSYIPLSVTGKYKDNIVAYSRQYKHDNHIIILPLNIAAIGKFEEINWGNTAVIAPDDLKGNYLYNFSGTSMQVGNTISVSSIFGDVPFAILSASGKENKRAAGVLLPVFSLEGDYGIGDFGRGAKAFIDFLKRGKQKYWQLLPLNPVDEGNMYSPYSSLSSMAMNPLLISPELLVEEKLIDKNILREYYFNEHGKVHYEYAHKVKFELLNLAYENFSTNNYTGLTIAYEAFCEKENYWLDDYSLFMALKHNLNMEAWHKWPDAYKKRDKTLLEDYALTHRAEIAKIKWVQFIADRQWNTVRGYCHRQGIKLFGDLPFYVSYDSVDVWANPDMFRIDKEGNMLGAAGVPPDYFSENGQHWGVPTYNWQHIKQTNYDWWVERLKKNMQLFDVVRIDHFRALEAYWEIPPGEETARNGKWIKGPGMDFFNVLEERLGKLPFIAEDLGYEMEDVYALREKSGLPGMKVLQFAFGDNMTTSVDIPHNYDNHCVAYTGTHDNNTTIGWYRLEAKPEDRHRLNEYTGKHVNEHNVHQVMAQMVYASVAEMAVLPMQDILGLDETARMNTPGTIYNNWSWRLPKKALNTDMENHLSGLTAMYNRL